MHVVRRKETREVLHVDQRTDSEPIDGNLIYEDFDDETMEVGWTDGNHIPFHFNIGADGRITEMSLARRVELCVEELGPAHKLRDGEIVAKTSEELVQDGVVTLEEMKSDYLNHLSELAFEERRKIIPDYKLQNAALGVYGAADAANYRETVQTFRSEFKRLQALVMSAESATELEAIEANFPTTVLAASEEAS